MLAVGRGRSGNDNPGKLQTVIAGAISMINEEAGRAGCRQGAIGPSENRATGEFRSKAAMQLRREEDCPLTEAQTEERGKTL